MGNPYQERTGDRCTRLLFQVVEGDAEAFNQLHRELYPDVFNFVVFLGRSLDFHCYEDIAQEVFFRLWQKRANYRGQSKAKTYLLGMAKFVLYEELARRKRAKMIFAENWDHLSGNDERAGQEAEGLEQKIRFDTIVRECLDQLSDKQRTAFELVHFQGLSIRQAARKMRCEERKICDRLYHARKRLRALMAPFRKLLEESAG